MAATKFSYVWVGHFPPAAVTERYAQYQKYLEQNPGKAKDPLGSGMQIEVHQPPPTVGSNIPRAGTFDGIDMSVQFMDGTLLHRSKSIFDRTAPFDTKDKADTWLKSEQGKLWTTGADNVVLMSVAGTWTDPKKP